MTEDSLYHGLKVIKPGERLSNISHAIQKFEKYSGFSIVRKYAEHGIGQELHEDPTISHYGPLNKPMLSACMFYIRPVTNV